MAAGSGAGRTASGGVVVPRREAFRLAGHGRPIVSLLAHPFLPLLVSGAADGTVRVWDLEGRVCLRTLIGHTGSVYGLSLDQKGRRLASGSADTTVRIWDLDSGACLRALEGHADTVWAMAWNASGSLVASGSDDFKVRLWDGDSGDLRHTIEACSSPVLSLIAHPTDDLFASGSEDFAVRVWQWSSRDNVRELHGHRDVVASLAASASFLVSGSYDKTVRVWSWATGECVRVLDGFAGALSGLHRVAWRGSTIITVESLGAIRVWDASASENASDWSCRGSLPSSAAHGSAVTIEGSGRVIFSVGRAVMISVWE